MVITIINDSFTTITVTGIYLLDTSSCTRDMSSHKNGAGIILFAAWLMLPDHEGTSRNVARPAYRE